jgi:hypothetical protein
MSNAEDQKQETIIFDLTDEPIVAYAIFPELPKP